MQETRKTNQRTPRANYKYEFLLQGLPVLNRLLLEEPRSTNWVNEAPPVKISNISKKSSFELSNRDKLELINAYELALNTHNDLRLVPGKVVIKKTVNKCLLSYIILDVQNNGAVGIFDTLDSIQILFIIKTFINSLYKLHELEVEDEQRIL